MNYWKFILWFWILFFAFVGWTYFFHPGLFHQMFRTYTGPGDPFVNYP